MVLSNRRETPSWVVAAKSETVGHACITALKQSRGVSCETYSLFGVGLSNYESSDLVRIGGLEAINVGLACPGCADSPL